MFKQRKNKRFGYKPRFQDSEEETLKDDLGAKWDEIRNHKKKRGGFLSTLPRLLIMLIALFVLMYILNTYIK